MGLPNDRLRSGKRTGGALDPRLATQVTTSFESERQSNTLLGLKDISAVLNEGEVIVAIIGRGILRV